MRITSLIMLGVGYVLALEPDGSAMTNSQNSYSEPLNGSTSSAQPDDEPRRGGIRVALRRDRRLADGMAIVAAIEARLLRMRVLSLNAVIDVVPAEATREGGGANEQPPPLPAAAFPGVGGRPAGTSPPRRPRSTSAPRSCGALASGFPEVPPRRPG